jgi:predicted metal-dependent hydrolase
MLPSSWLLILFISLVNTFALLRKDKRLWTRDTLAGLAYLFGRRGMVSGLLPAFFAFFRPRFHPWKDDNSAEIQSWLNANQRYVRSESTAKSASIAPAPSATSAV